MSNFTLIDETTVLLPFIPLSEAENGARFRIRELRSAPEVCQRLREMGFCEDAEVSMLSRSGGLICQVCGSRVALSSRLGREIFVEAIRFPV